MFFTRLAELLRRAAPRIGVGIGEREPVERLADRAAQPHIGFRRRQLIGSEVLLFPLRILEARAGIDADRGGFSIGILLFLEQKRDFGAVGRREDEDRVTRPGDEDVVHEL